MLSIRRREAIGEMLAEIDRLDALVGELRTMTRRVARSILGPKRGASPATPGTLTFRLRDYPDCRGLPKVRDGSERNPIGGCPDMHLLGTQFGPSRDGREW